MKRNNILLTAILLLLSTCNLFAQTNARDVVRQMTLQEKAEMVIGHLWSLEGFDYPGLGMSIGGAPRLGYPVTICSDGSYGLKKYIKMSNGKYGSTAFPIPIGMASSWNIPLVETVGEAFGDEAKEYGVDILLGPALNIHRDPLCGRNFEYYSEDPLIAGFMGSAYVDGIQRQGIGATPKHFAANNQETDRIINDSRVSTRALREIYLRGFEHIVKHSHPWALMSAYNRLNGTQCGENRELLQTVTRGEWGFDGIFMTDFGGQGWSPLQIAAGNDLVMPGSTYHIQNILNAVKSGELKEADIDACCERIINYIQKTQHYKKYPYSRTPDLDAHAQVARRAALETFVLLKNEGNALPLSGTPAFFGTGSYDTRATGIGSGKVTCDYVVSIADGFKEKNQTIADYYAQYIRDEKQKATKGMKFKQRTKTLETLLLAEVLPSKDTLDKVVAESSIGVMTITRNAGEGADRRPVKGDWLLSDSEMQTLRTLSAAYHQAGKQLVVLLNIPSAIETASWKDLADAIMIVWLPGQEGGNAVANVLKGRVSPSGKLTTTFPIRYEDVPTYGNFPTGNEGSKVDYDANGYQADADNMKQTKKADADPAKTIFENGKTRHQDPPQSQWVKNLNYTNYEEDVYVGYRYYDTFKKAVSYPFGFGLTYSSFRYSNMTVAPQGDGYEVTVTVTNTGKAKAKEIVEVYGHMPAIKEGRPVHELLAFGKTRELQPGESQTLTMHFSRRQLCWYSDADTAWMLEKGKYTITCAASSQDRGISKTIKIRKREAVEKTTSALRPKVQLHLLKP